MHNIRRCASTVRKCMRSKSCVSIASGLMRFTYVHGLLETSSCQSPGEFMKDTVKLDYEGSSVYAEVEMIHQKAFSVSLCLTTLQRE